MSEQIYTGRCFCGSIQFSVSGHTQKSCFCHCHSCQHAAGAPYLIWVSFPTESFRLLQGELRIYESSTGVERGFCGQCGSTISYAHQDRAEYVDITLSCMDEKNDLQPNCHIWVSNKDPAVIIGDELPQYDQWRTGPG